MFSGNCSWNLNLLKVPIQMHANAFAESSCNYYALFSLENSIIKLLEEEKTYGRGFNI